MFFNYESVKSIRKSTNRPMVHFYYLSKSVFLTKTTNESESFSDFSTVAFPFPL